MQLPEERAALVEYCLRMQADDLTVGTSGNLSVRSGHLIAITPSGVVYDDLTPEAICVIDLDGNVVEADLDPSSEVPMHTSVYRATDAGAVVHSHPLYCTALSVTMDEVPPVHYMITLLGGPIRVAPLRPVRQPGVGSGQRGGDGRPHRRAAAQSRRHHLRRHPG
jgi:L-fuculose-phosphate aldolase